MAVGGRYLSSVFCKVGFSNLTTKNRWSKQLTTMEKINIISLGAGRQSSYMLLEALTGKFEYKPDCAIFSDTGCEPSYVYSYLKWLTEFVWEEFNFQIHIVSAGNLIDDTLSYINGDRKSGISIPLFVNPSKSPIRRQCTDYYKIRPVRKQIRKMYGKVPVRLWIGISYDEIERMKISQIGYIENYYPLVEKKINLFSIIKFYKQSNFPIPNKSSCIICPFHSMRYWQTLRDRFPEDFKVAVTFDNQIRNLKNLSGTCYLSKSMVPLSEIYEDNQFSLFPELLEECSGMCGL
jgi:hypothetical protein